MGTSRLRGTRAPPHLQRKTRAPLHRKTHARRHRRLKMRARPPRETRVLLLLKLEGV